MMLYDSYEIIPVEILLGVGWGGGGGKDQRGYRLTVSLIRFNELIAVDIYRLVRDCTHSYSVVFYIRQMKISNSE